MISLPDSCIGCPFYSKALYFTPDKIIESSDIFILAQNPGEYEESGREIVKTVYNGRKPLHITRNVKPQPLIGPTGKMLNQRFLPLANLDKDKISLGNAIKCRPYGQNSLPRLQLKETREAIKKCKQYLNIPKKVKLIITLGEYALFSLTNISGLTETKKGGWRGYAFSYNNPEESLYKYVDLSNIAKDDKIIFPTLHIASLFKDQSTNNEITTTKKYFHAMLNDFYKIKLILQKKWPKPLPEMKYNPPVTFPKISAFDTEYTPENNLIRWSLSDGKDTYVVEANNTSSINIPHESIIYGQNILVDIDHLSKIINLNRVKIHDLMLMHSVLWTGEPHSLNYILSMYGSHNRHKHLSDQQPQLYAGLDAYGTYEASIALRKELLRDIKSLNIYQNYRLPLLPIIYKAERRGIEIDRERIILVEQFLKNLQAVKALKAMEITKNSFFNIASQQQVKDFLCNG